MIDYDTLPNECRGWARTAAGVLGLQQGVITKGCHLIPAVWRPDGGLTEYNPFDPDSEDSLTLLKALNAEIKYWTQHIQVSFSHPYWPGGRTSTTKMFVQEYTRADVAFSLMEFFYEAHQGWMLSAERGHAPDPRVPF